VLPESSLELNVIRRNHVWNLTAHLSSVYSKNKNRLTQSLLTTTSRIRGMFPADGSWSGSHRILSGQLFLGMEFQVNRSGIRRYPLECN
jgi:hypothetical protein